MSSMTSETMQWIIWKESQQQNEWIAQTLADAIHKEFPQHIISSVTNTSLEFDEFSSTPDICVAIVTNFIDISELIESCINYNTFLCLIMNSDYLETELNDLLKLKFPLLYFRISSPIGIYPNKELNVLTKMMDNPQRINSIPRKVSDLHSLFPIVVRLCHKKQSGMFVLVNTGSISTRQIADLYTEMMSPHRNIFTDIHPSPPPTLTEGEVEGVISNEHGLEKTGGMDVQLIEEIIAVPHAIDAVKDSIQILKNTTCEMFSN